VEADVEDAKIQELVQDLERSTNGANPYDTLSDASCLCLYRAYTCTSLTCTLNIIFSSPC
jgi:hypothetical protein